MRTTLTRIALLTAAAVLALTGCGVLARRVPVGEAFELLPGERVWVLGTGLYLELGSVGQAWTVDGAEIPFADLTVVTGFRPRSRELTVGERWYVGGATIYLRAADPFGENRCSFEVTEGP